MIGEGNELGREMGCWKEMGLLRGMPWVGEGEGDAFGEKEERELRRGSGGRVSVH